MFAQSSVLGPQFFCSVLVPHVCSMFHFGPSSSFHFVLILHVCSKFCFDPSSFQKVIQLVLEFFPTTFSLKKKEKTKLTFISQQFCYFTKGKDLNAKEQNCWEMKVSFFSFFLLNRKSGWKKCQELTGELFRNLRDQIRTKKT